MWSCRRPTDTLKAIVAVDVTWEKTIPAATRTRLVANLLDTNVVSELRNRKTRGAVLAWLRVICA